MLKLSFAMAILLLSLNSFAVQLHVQLITADNEALAEAVIYLQTTEQQSVPPRDTEAIMDQVNRQYVPHVLAVQKGTSVIFPNSDSIKHHVYSFSPAKTFELQLYKGALAQPQVFDKAGIVELGCNVHDWMLGYIFVTDTPFFGTTNSKGELSLTVPVGHYKLRIWHPRLQPFDRDDEQVVVLTADSSIQKKLSHPLLQSYRDLGEDDDEFDAYD